MRRLSRAYPLALLLTAAILFSGCFSQSQLDRAAKASRNIATYTGQAITLTATLWASGAIKDIAIKDAIAQKLIDFSKAGGEFNALLIRLSDQYKDGKVPPDVWRQITNNFDQLSASFLALLNLIPQVAGMGDSKAFRIISASVLAIAQVLMANAKLVGPQPGENFRQLREGLARAGVTPASDEEAGFSPERAAQTAD